jgi:hypothetical protein
MHDPASHPHAHSRRLDVVQMSLWPLTRHSGRRCFSAWSRRLRAPVAGVARSSRWAKELWKKESTAEMTFKHSIRLK